MKTSLNIAVSLILLCPCALEASQHLFYREVNLIGGYSEKNNWVGRSEMLKNSVGFEDFRKFSGDYGDYLTTDFQARLANDSKEPSDDAWAVEIHNAWLEFKSIGNHKLRVGHFDPAFGLEPTVDTHATIFQTLSMKNIGFKKDWGVSVRGLAPSFDYETALTIGSGMGLRRRNGSYLATLRAGSPAGNNLQYGLSALLGRTLQTKGMGTIPRNELLSDETVIKKRAGIDAAVLYGPFNVKAEGAYGTDNGTRVLGYLAEVNYTIPRSQQWKVDLQYSSWINNLKKGGTDNTNLGLGASYRIREEMTLRTAYIRDLYLANGEKDETILFQAYYFGR